MGQLRNRCKKEEEGDQRGTILTTMMEIIPLEESPVMSWKRTGTGKDSFTNVGIDFHIRERKRERKCLTSNSS